MAASPATAKSVSRLRKQVAEWRAAGDRVALVPTMGALHVGHLSLVERARRQAERTVVSIFVNPTQFGPGEDFERYPRDRAGDLKKLADAGVDLAFMPTVTDMYPEGFATTIDVKGPATAGLEDKYRPHHFNGVATVVCKLLTQCMPDIAIFGEKDYQQLLVIRRMVADLNLPMKIAGGATVRERDGLALSSRNAYLSPDERAIAPGLQATLKDAAARIKDGHPPAKVMAAAHKSLTRMGFQVDYVEARNADTLAPLSGKGGKAGEPIRLLTAARLGRTRLIDNIAVK